MKTDKRKFIADLILKTGFYLLAGLVIVQIIKSYKIISIIISSIVFILIMLISIIIYPDE